MAFLGKNIGVTRIEVSSQGGQTSVGFDLSFKDDEGRVHATTRHRLTDLPPAMRSPAAELLAAIQEWAKQVHFGSQDRREAEAADAYGIAESLRGETDSPDDIAGQG